MSRLVRLVSSWKLCCEHDRITPNTRWMNATGTSEWNRSPIEQRKTILGLRQPEGVAISASWAVTANPFLNFATPIACSRLAIRSA